MRLLSSQTYMHVTRQHSDSNMGLLCCQVPLGNEKHPPNSYTRHGTPSYPSLNLGLDQCFLFLFVCHLKLHRDGVADINTFPDKEGNFNNEEKVNSVLDFVYQRDGILSDGSNKLLGINSTGNRSKRNFIALNRYWRDPEAIPYMLDISLGSSGRKAFQAAINEFEKNTCIRFTRRLTRKILSGFIGDRDASQPLGDLVENRNQFIRINVNNIKPKAKVEYRVLKGYVIGEPYDYGSVMHYGFNFFSVDPKRPIIVKLMPGGKQMGQREGFSDLDLRKINKCYNCTSYIRDCSFDKGLCNWKNWRNEVEDQFDWMIGKAAAKSYSGKTRQPSANYTTERFLFFTKPSTKSEYMSSGVLYSAGFFKGSSCLRFYYYMRAGGYLRVFIKESVSKKRNPFVMIWEKQGPQGNRWNLMEKSISGAMIKIYIEGIKTPNLSGFVAIDEIRVLQGRTCVGIEGAENSEVVLRRRFTPLIPVEPAWQPSGTRKGETILHGQKCIGLVQE
ncbi:hypothetical protein OS493_033427 [Desmophyllum pertusum]|uniref:Metalloendopeptidase n=1 Tax=Desmophyllum pertusum TaxID=174260 RepID=A0A9W9ZX34_9CNID|nr:hypothetical protein OS493_033427 [Desmophyllum pertusum]